MIRMFSHIKTNLLAYLGVGSARIEPEAELHEDKDKGCSSASSNITNEDSVSDVSVADLKLTSVPGQQSGFYSEEQKRIAI